MNLFSPTRGKNGSQHEAIKEKGNYMKRITSQGHIITRIIVISMFTRRFPKPFSWIRLHGFIIF